jgi:hypothetical protein
MKPENPSELEAILHRELRKLPGYKAPQSLSQRVMATIHAQSQVPWWRQPIWAWSMPVRAAFLSILVASVGWLLYAVWQLTGVPGKISLPAPVERFLATVSSLGELLAILANAASLLLSSGLQPWVWGAIGIIFFLYVCCLGAGTMFMRLAWKKI